MAKCPMSKPLWGWELPLWANRSYDPTGSRHKAALEDPGGQGGTCSQTGLKNSTSSLALTKQTEITGKYWGDKYPACSSKTSGRSAREYALCGELERKDAKQLWHKLPVLQDSSTSTALGKQKNAPTLNGLTLGHSMRPTDHYKNDGL